LIKYLGSKRALLTTINTLASATKASSALDLFTGTTRVGASLKSLGMHVTAIDTASYSEVFGKTFIELDSSRIATKELAEAIEFLNSLPGEAGYFTETYCEKARFFQRHNGIKIDAIRAAIQKQYRNSWLYYPLLTALILAADRVDSTTGVQMAYLKSWSRRSFLNLDLKAPDLLAGGGSVIRADVNDVVPTLAEVDLAYVDPPYNQHRYFSNYHIWETLVRFDKPEHYGIANKRLDARDLSNKSPYNSKLTMPQSLGELIANLKTKTLMLSYNNESWLSRRQLKDMCAKFEKVAILDFDFKRYVGSQIGVYNQSGELVGKPGAKRNLEHIVVAGSGDTVNAMLKALGR
jgi:adenine-specific DNA-methyltransferase